MLDFVVDKLLSHVKAIYLSLLIRQKTLVEANQSLVLHLSVAPIADSMLSLIGRAQLYLIETAFLAHRYSTFCAILLLFPLQSEVFD